MALQIKSRIPYLEPALVSLLEVTVVRAINASINHTLFFIYFSDSHTFSLESKINRNARNPSLSRFLHVRMQMRITLHGV